MQPIKSGVSYTCNYFFIDSWRAAHGMISHEICLCCGNLSVTPEGKRLRRGMWKMLHWRERWSLYLHVWVFRCLSMSCTKHFFALMLTLVSSNSKVLELMYQQWLIVLSLCLSYLSSPASFPLLQAVRNRGRWDLPALCWSCCTSRCHSV